MDLSQQELPLTAYFTRAGKEVRTASHKRDKSTEDSQLVACSSKRRKSDVGYSTTSSSNSPATVPSKPRVTTLQLPTPVASSRKRLRGGRLQELPGEAQPTSTGGSLPFIKRNVIPSNKDIQLEFGLTSSKSSRNGADDGILELPSTPLARVSTDRRNTSKPNGPGSRLANNIEVGIPTPQTSSRGTSKPVHGVDDHYFSARSNRYLPSKSSPPHSTVDLGCSSPNHAREKGNVFMSRNEASAPTQLVIQSKTLEGRPSDGCTIPMFPVSSSQSQYLLHPDATPKRKRRSQHTEHVMSSQSQEERELSLSTFGKLIATASSSVDASPGKHTLHGSVQTLRPGVGERKSHCVQTVTSSPVKSPITSSASPFRPLATRGASDALSFKSPSPLRHKRLASYHSPSRETKSPQGLACHHSPENFPLAHMEDSLTESDSDSNDLQVPHRSPIPRTSLLGNVANTEDDSATEAESDTEILHCFAEIGKQRPNNPRSEMPRENSPPPVISPLVSPTRPRIAAMSSNTHFTQLSLREGTTLGASGSAASTVEPPQTHLESLPSVVREFIRMFPGDESYPADFPESLRI